mmetsp:Transcript_97136/g.118967  ORF Transcript_97136/g.118967 Transcript_97136/m.118967 type:complete len:279 (-) Transcript_97136:805-1641(-)
MREETSDVSGHASPARGQTLVSLSGIVLPLVLDDVFHVDIFRVEEHKFPVRATCLFAVTTNRVEGPFDARVYQRFRIWSDLIGVAYIAANHATEKDCITSLVVGLGVLIRLCDGLREIESFAIQSARAGARAAHFEVRFTNCSGCIWIGAMEKVPLVTLREQSVGLVTPDLIHRETGLNISEDFWKLWALHDIPSPEGVLLPGSLVLIPIHSQNLETFWNLWVCWVVLATVFGIGFPVGFIQKLLKLFEHALALACQFDHFIELTFVIVPIRRKRNFT